MSGTRSRNHGPSIGQVLPGPPSSTTDKCSHVGHPATEELLRILGVLLRFRYMRIPKNKIVL